MEESHTTPQPWVIKGQGLTKSFGNRLALNGIDLDVEQGESIAIFGPNGAGKTTLIKVLATILKPSSGSLLVDGLNLKDNAEEIRRRIGMVTHQTYLYGNLTADENLEFYCRMYDVPVRKERIAEVVNMVGITPHLRDRVDTLSRGVRQRLAIARSLLHNPSILLLDEPETGLDVEAATVLWDWLQAERKRTIIHTTHNLERGFEQCDRLLILARGKITYQGSKKDLEMTDLRQAYRQYTGVRE